VGGRRKYKLFSPHIHSLARRGGKRWLAAMREEKGELWVVQGGLVSGVNGGRGGKDREEDSQ